MGKPHASGSDQGTARAAELRREGARRRRSIKRSDHAALQLPDDRDPLGILAEQNSVRLQDLVGVRMSRMLQSPFAYYRGIAGPMAHDLTAGRSTDVHVVACGDAHLSNFGLFASPERALLFDLNDFDEGGIAPWEWDLKRLAASIHIAGRGAGWGEQVLRDLTADAVRAYQSQLAELMERSALERFYAALPLDDIGALSIDGADRKMIQKVVDKARRRTSEQVLGKLTTTTEDGHLVIVDQPPITRHLENPDWERLRTLLNQYRATLREDVAVLLYQFEPVDVVLRVVGVGSVGTRCYVVLFTGPAGEPLFLQIKEARASVLVTYGGMPSGLPGRPDARPRCQGHRVVAAQRILQSHSDRFLGWLTAPLTDRSRDAGDFYWRQFRDMKGSVDVDRLSREQFGRYVRACARMLARAHSQSEGAHMIAGYLGSDSPFAEAIAQWSTSYADVCESDYEALAAAARSGRFPVETGL